MSMASPKRSRREGMSPWQADSSQHWVARRPQCFGDRDRRAMRAGEDGGTSARSLLRPTDRPVISPWIYGR